MPISFPTIDAFVAQAARVLATGPVALIFAEDAVEVEATVTHHLQLGFQQVVLFCGTDVAAPAIVDPAVHCVMTTGFNSDRVVQVVSRIARAIPAGTWVYYCFNGEFLFYPFCETRNITEMLAFHAEERRDAMLTYIVDLYAADLEAHPNAVDLLSANLDKSGYYALPRSDPENLGHPLERQLDFFGGLRWRYEEHVPADKRRIDRISVFRAKRDLTLRPDFTFSDPEYNTYACPWHHNLTAAVCSFRSAKALKANPGSRYDIPSFQWRNSEPFQWKSQQLLDLGLMEPGQWF